tara:strand:+ start:574 stop:786 length:213 start_codon:yes stop_codon:yes gene_type:complete
MIVNNITNKIRLSLDNKINNKMFTQQQLSILHRALKVYKIDLLSTDFYDKLDYKEALESVRIKIKELYEK